MNVSKKVGFINSSFFDKFLIEAFFGKLFEDFRHDRCLTLSLTDRVISKQKGFSDHELEKLQNFALEQLPRRKSLKECVALQTLEKYFLFKKQ